MKKIILIAGLLVFNLYCFGQKKDTLSLNDYLTNHQLDYAIEVESNKNILTVYGYPKNDDSELLSRRIKLSRYDVLGINEWSWFWHKGHFKPLPISITTVPFKVRPELDEFETNAISGITNVGLNFDLGRWKTERYFASGKKTTHKFNVGIWIAPIVQELDSIQTSGYLVGDKKSKQLFASTALTLNYTYNNLTFTFVPLGFDLATSGLGNEWVYNRIRWWGFGIGLEPKFLNTIANK